jgi:hypothetical protein
LQIALKAVSANATIRLTNRQFTNQAARAIYSTGGFFHATTTQDQPAVSVEAAFFTFGEENEITDDCCQR